VRKGCCEEGGCKSVPDIISPIRVLALFDSFKGSLSSLEAGNAAARGYKRAIKKAKIDVYPFSDGGEGFVEAYRHFLRGRLVSLKVTGPLPGSTVKASYLLIGKTAVIELASASGFALVRSEDRNPLITTTFGTGALIVDAVKKGATRLILGLGGSATVDFGSGILEALGCHFLDKKSKIIERGGGNLERLHKIKVTKEFVKYRKIKFLIATDVQNRLLGSRGIRLFIPQKGGTSAMTARLERGARQLAAIARKDFQKSISRLAGGGAAGGVAAGLSIFLKIALVPGAELLFKVAGLDKKIRSYDLVLTGEGCIDRGTLEGKIVKCLASICKKKKIPVFVFAGALGNGYNELYKTGATKISKIASVGVREKDAFKHAGLLLSEAAYRLGRAG